jgi:hypothetical protein
VFSRLHDERLRGLNQVRKEVCPHIRKEKVMKTFCRRATTIRVIALIPLITSILLLSVSGRPMQNQLECTSKSKSVKAVTSPDYHFTTAVYNFPADGVGHFDSVPLLSTTVEVGGGKPSCLIAHFSAVAAPNDNHVMFQVRVDGVPMRGHLSGTGGIATPFVSDPEETDMNLPRMVAYNFFTEVRPGLHTVDVLFAGCCSAAPPPDVVVAAVGSPVLTLEYEGL